MRLDLSLSQRPEMQLRLSPQLIQRIVDLALERGGVKSIAPTPPVAVAAKV